MPFVQVEDGTRIHYRDGGFGRPLVFLHGLGGNVDAWSYQVLALQGTHRCICMDLRGHGRSDKPLSDYTFAELCQDLRRLLEHLNLQDVVLVGHSLAGALCLQHLLDHNAGGRVVKAALVGATTPRMVQSEAEPFGAGRETLNGVLELVRTSYPEALAAMAPALLHRQDLESTRDWILASAQQIPAYAAYRLYGSAFAHDIRDRLSEVAAPIEFLHGRHDQIADPRWIDYAANRLPHCHVTWFDNSGHYPMLEEPDELSSALADFAGQEDR